MDGSKDTGPHSTKTPQVTDEAAVHPAGISLVGIFHLLWESIVLQPRQQLQIHSNALITVLRSMHVHIVHGGDEQTVAEVGDVHLITTKRAQVSQRGQVGGNACHQPVLDGDITILQYLKAAALRGKKDICLVNLSHSPAPAIQL